MGLYTKSFELVGSMYCGSIYKDGLLIEELWSRTISGILTKLNIKIALLESNDNSRKDSDIIEQN